MRRRRLIAALLSIVYLLEKPRFSGCGNSKTVIFAYLATTDSKVKVLLTRVSPVDNLNTEGATEGLT